MINFPKVNDEVDREKDPYPLRENFNNPDKYEWMRGEGMERIIQGLLAQKSQKCDRFVSEELTNHLFPKDGLTTKPGIGGDLIAR